MRNDSAERFFSRYIVPVIEWLCALGASAVAYLGAYASTRASVLGQGPSPASNLAVLNLPQSLVTQYDKIFVENLKGNTAFLRCANRRMLDENAGNKLMLFMYQNLPAPPLTQAPEGTIQSGLTVTVNSNVTEIGVYADYLNISTFALQTAIDPALEALGVQAAYRLAQVINMILQNEADGANAVDPLVGHLSLTGNVTMATVDITAAVQSLAGVNALPFEDGRYFGVIHPFVVGDILSTQTRNDIVDVIKRTAAGNERLKELPAPDGDAVTVLDWGGATFFQSTFVTQTPNYSGTALTAFRTYIFGRDGIIAISFGARENTQIGNGDWRNLNVWVRRLTEPSGYDPSLQIGGFASYRTNFAATLVPDTVMRMRYIDAVSAIS